MLVLSRRISESLLIGDQIEIVVLESGKNRVRLGIAAPRHVVVMRPEARQRVSREDSSPDAAPKPQLCLE